MISGKISATSNEYNFVTVRNSATLADVVVNDTLTVNSQLTTSQNLAVDTLTLEQLTVGTGTVPTGAALLAVTGSTLAITQSTIVCSSSDTTVAGVLVPQEGITVSASFPSSALSFSSGILTGVAPAAVIAINTTLVSGGSSGPSSFALPLVSTGTYDFTVYWGDASSSVITAYNQPEVTHTYAVNGFYTLTITGTLTGWVFSDGGDKLKLLDISAWGDLVLGINGEYSFFRGCANLNISAPTGSPLRAGTTSLSECFRDCTSLNSANIGTWDVSAVQDMSRMFESASLFNADLSSWDTSSVTLMISMFTSASAFNSPIGTWDVSAVKNMNNMFWSCTAFNSPIGTWDVGAVQDMTYMFLEATAFNQQLSSWNTVSATTMYGMFQGASAFNNGALSNIGGAALLWTTPNLSDTSTMFSGCPAFNQRVNFTDMSKVTSTSDMFLGCTVFNNGDPANSSATPLAWTTTALITADSMFISCPVFNQALTFSDTSRVTNFSAMMIGCILFKQNLSAWVVTACLDFTAFYTGDLNNPDSATSQANYDALLIAWAAQALQPGVTLDMGTTKYSAAATASRNTLTTVYGWTVNDGGVAP
jgi:surface protein